MVVWVHRSTVHHKTGKYTCIQAYKYPETNKKEKKKVSHVDECPSRNQTIFYHSKTTVTGPLDNDIGAPH
jgi:hypothetical protein